MRRSLALAALLLAAPAAQAAPQVAADILPVHSLVARVMQGVGTPALIVPPGASPHGYAMRPSEARSLAGAEVVVWVGERLTPWLAAPIGTLAEGATVVELMEAEGTTLLPVRESATFERHSHGDDDHAHGAEAKAGHVHDYAHDAHDHDAADAHLWLDPENARVWLGAIAEALAGADPANAAAYRANADAARAELAALEAEIAATLAPVRKAGFIVFHDAYQYFEHRFGMPAAGSVILSDAEALGAARVAEIRGKLAALDVRCIFAEPQFEPRLVATITEGTALRTGTLDPLGAGREPGPALYPAVLRGLADSLAGCLGG